MFDISLHFLLFIYFYLFVFYKSIYIYSLCLIILINWIPNFLDYYRKLLCNTIVLSINISMCIYLQTCVFSFSVIVIVVVIIIDDDGVGPCGC